LATGEGQWIETTHLPFVQVTSGRGAENTRSGVIAICHAAPVTGRHSYKIIYSEILEEREVLVSA
jgi:hypothetical protein